MRVLGLDRWEAPAVTGKRPLEDIFQNILNWAEANGRIDGGIASRDILDTELMGRLTPRPSEVRRVLRVTAAALTIPPGRTTG